MEPSEYRNMTNNHKKNNIVKEKLEIMIAITCQWIEKEGSWRQWRRWNDKHWAPWSSYHLQWQFCTIQYPLQMTPLLPSSSRPPSSHSPPCSFSSSFLFPLSWICLYLCLFSSSSFLVCPFFSVIHQQAMLKQLWGLTAVLSWKGWCLTLIPCSDNSALSVEGKMPCSWSAS